MNGEQRCERECLLFQSIVVLCARRESDCIVFECRMSCVYDGLVSTGSLSCLSVQQMYKSVPVVLQSQLPLYR